MFENKIPIYFEVVDNCCVEIHKPATLAGGRLIKVKTDAIVVENCSQVECKNGIGNYRKERILEDYKISPPFLNNYKYELESKDWVNTTTNPHRLIYGGAGTGKTTTIKKDFPKLGRYKLLATTNKAAKLLGRQTIHSFSGIKINSLVDYCYVIKVVSVDTSVIDEASMIRASVFEVLYYIKLNKPTLKFVMVGDKDQKFNYDYFDSFVIKEPQRHQRQELIVNIKFNKELFKFFD